MRNTRAMVCALGLLTVFAAVAEPSLTINLFDTKNEDGATVSIVANDMPEGGVIRYEMSTWGSTPCEWSPIYTEPLEIIEKTVVCARIFVGYTEVGQMVERTVDPLPKMTSLTYPGWPFEMDTYGDTEWVLSGETTPSGGAVLSLPAVGLEGGKLRLTTEGPGVLSCRYRLWGNELNVVMDDYSSWWLGSWSENWRIWQYVVEDSDHHAWLFNFERNCHENNGASLGDLVWTPAPKSIGLTFDARGGAFDDPKESTVDYSTGGCYGWFPWVEREGYIFAGWSRSAEREDFVSEDDWVDWTSTDRKLYAVWWIDPWDILVESGADDWSVGEDWVGLPTGGPMGGPCLRRGADDCDNCCGGICLEDPYFQLSVSGRGELSFWYRFSRDYCDSEDALSFFVDGEFSANLGGREAEGGMCDPYHWESDVSCGHWKRVVIPVGVDGNHEISWETNVGYWHYANAYLADVAWTPAGGAATITFDANGGTVNPRTKVYSTFGTYGSLPRPTRPGYTFVGWFAEGTEGTIGESSAAPLVDKTLKAEWTASVPTALSESGLPASAFRYDGPSWFGQTKMSYDATGAAQSGAVKDGESTSLAVTIPGPAKVTFKWKISAYEWGSDLNVSVGGRKLKSIRGERDWETVSLALTDPINTVSWTYEKNHDPWYSYGWADCGWVDALTIEPLKPQGDLYAWGADCADYSAWIAGSAPTMLANYTARIAANPADYEARILRAVARLIALGENANLKTVLAKFGFAPVYSALLFQGELKTDGAPLPDEVVDSVALEALPVLREAIADLEAIPSDWKGEIALTREKIPALSEAVYLDRAEVAAMKSLLYAARSTLYLAQGYHWTFDYEKLKADLTASESFANGKAVELLAKHPQFFTLRNASALATAKADFDKSLALVQAADAALRARTSGRLHFFEYDPADADIQRRTRELVAKIRASLAGTVEVDLADYRDLLGDDDFGFGWRHQLYLGALFSGRVTRALAPTFIDDTWVPLAGTWPDATFGGLFPGKTAVFWDDILAGSLYDPYETLNGALDNLNLVFANDGNSPWTVDATTSWKGKTSLRSTNTGRSTTSSVTTTAVGPGTLSFVWRASCEDDGNAATAKYDHGVCRIDGKDYALIDGESGWRTVSVSLGAGPHTIVWSYVKDAQWMAGEDCLWLDAVSWTAKAVQTPGTGGGSGVSVSPNELAGERSPKVDAEGGETAPYAAAAVVYNGLVLKDGVPAGSAEVKVAKFAKGSAKVTATVQLGATKLSFKNGLADAAGAVTPMSASGHTLNLTLGVDGLGGTMDGGVYTIDGARNLFSSKDKAEKASAEAFAKTLVGVANVALPAGRGFLSVAIAAKGKVKISGVVDGAKVSATSQMVLGAKSCAVPLVLTKKVSLVGTLWLDADRKLLLTGAGLEAAIVGWVGTLQDGATLQLDAAALAEAIPGLYTTYLPSGLSVSQTGTKWIVAGGAKAGKVVLDKKTGAVDEAKLGANPSGLKLTFKAKDGTFKGSFRAYALEKGKVKAYTINVEGVLVGDTAYGTASSKRPAFSCGVTL